MLAFNTVPPSPPVIVDYPHGTVVQVNYQQSTLNLTCKSTDGKPAANLTWYRNGVAVTGENMPINHILYQFRLIKKLLQTKFNKFNVW